MSENSDSFDALLERAARLSPVPWPASARLHPGMELGAGRFQILRRIGAGGMGVVYEAFDRERAGEVAIKTLTRLDANGIYRLKNEFRALADVMHPNLVRLHDLVAAEGLWLFSMELVHGRELDAWVRPEGKLDEARLRHAFAQLVSGVNAIHGAGKLHRDLKPSNVLAADGGRVVVLDFGLVADPGEGGRGQTRDTGVSGTPHYMAPEQASGDLASEASDRYALGVMLFEALTGRLPFDGRVLQILQRKQADAAPRASSFVANVPQDLDALCAALLDRDPKARPDGAALAQAFAAHESTARPSQPPRPPARETQLVGRETELHALREAHAAARAGQAALVSIRGASGIGKTSLAHTFLDELRQLGNGVVLAGRCYERESVPYKAFDHVVDELTRYLRQLRDVEAAALMPRDASALARVFPVLSRVDAVASQPARKEDDAGEARRRAFAAFAELLGRLRDRHMLVLFVDDVHWLDHDSMLLFEHLLGDSDPPPLLCVIGHRDDAGEALVQRVLAAAKENRRWSTREIELGPLSEAASLSLLQHLLPGARREWAQAIASEAEGIPFFVGELARAAQAGGEGRGGISLERVLHERVTHLGESARTLLSVLALAGQPVPVDTLVHAAGPCEDPHRALDLLRNAHLVREAGNRRYDCYHDRIRAAISGSLDAASARHIHAQLAAAWSSRPDADPETLLSHWLAAGEREQAAKHTVAAAERAAASLAFDRAASYLQHAIEMLPASEVDALDLRVKRADALLLAGRWSAAAYAYDDAGEHAATPEKREPLVLRSAISFLGSGHGDQGLPRLRDVLQRAGVRWPRTAFGALLGALARLAWLWLRAGDGIRFEPPSARALAQANPQLLARLDADILERWLESAGLVPAYDLARGLYFMSVFSLRALRSGDDAQVGLALGMLSALFSASKLTRGRSRAFRQRACMLARSHDNPVLRSATLGFAAYASLLDAQPAAALELGLEAERALEVHGRGAAYTGWAARTAQAYALFALGRMGEAARVCELTARIALESGDDMALVGGDSALRYLVHDDIAGARTLLARKARMIERTHGRGVLGELLRGEQVFCALYEGRGDAAVEREVERSGLLALFDPGMPLACAALQSDPRGTQPRTRRIVARALARLRSQSDIPSCDAMAWQLTAAQRLFARDSASAQAALNRAAEQYAAAGMELHSRLMQMRSAKLRNDASADPGQADAFMRMQGIAKPDVWARMLAPGLDP